MSKIIGIDEVGRGPLAGPVMVAALIMPCGLNLRRKTLPKLKDSKKLSALQRETWFNFIRNHPKIDFTVAKVGPRTIDRINIAQSANLAATRAFFRLVSSEKVIGHRFRTFLDGGLYLNPKKLVTIHYDLKPKTIVKGDEKINAVKLASIAAKVTRDRYMLRLHKKNPVYGFDSHKGYGTKSHRTAIRKFGQTRYHRKSFIHNA